MYIIMYNVLHLILNKSNQKNPCTYVYAATLQGEPGNLEGGSGDGVSQKRQLYPALPGFSNILYNFIRTFYYFDI